MEQPEVTIIDGGDISSDLTPELAARGAQFISTGVGVLLPFFENTDLLAIPLIKTLGEYERSMLLKQDIFDQKKDFDAMCDAFRNRILDAAMAGKTGLAKVTTIPWKVEEKERVKHDRDIISVLLDMPSSARAEISRRMMISMVAKALSKAGVNTTDLPEDVQEALKMASKDTPPKQTH